MKVLKIYEPKKLIDGSVIGRLGKFVAIPDKLYKDKRIEVRFDGQIMLIKDWNKEAQTFRRFRDKWGGKDYTLAYFEWKSNRGETEVL